ncbi:MAG: methylated-DNA--[protein]-cysteine S-methyltransferase [Candidatus Obscuribacter phosphatis]|uniref:methylated-DNA--[protein]-cysteine S-methyltransferase n=1 Tax=Candidatus Obscuribacter phosphatis TaxID=1906157 RepID=A0A8J7TN88_9BACT|nr:methylated-DNA--[protein]-cysteine S-methyltransferase [Candidatus Obscuribacter phosphatis]
MSTLSTLGTLSTLSTLSTLTIIEKVCRLIEKAEKLPSLSDLSKHCGVSPHHLHRVFKESTGLTPRQYALCERRERLERALKEGKGMTEALFEAGYNSTGRFYEKANELLGMKPEQYKKKGQGTQIFFAVGTSNLGEVLVARSAKGICAILIGDCADALLDDLQERFANAEIIGADSTFDDVVGKIVGQIESPSLDSQIGDLPLDIQGTLFQRRVYNTLRQIPIGETISYQELATLVGAPKAVRAVASACASNKLAIAIPCHRVVRKSGEISGYRWGIERKRILLEREKSVKS